MAVFLNSELLKRILERAEALQKEAGSEYLVSEHILAASLDLVPRYANSGAATEEVARTMSLFQRLSSSIPEAKSALEAIVRDYKPSSMDNLFFQKILYSAQNAAKNRNGELLTLDVLLECILNSPPKNISKMIKVDEPKKGAMSSIPVHMPRQEAPAEQAQPAQAQGGQKAEEAPKSASAPVAVPADLDLGMLIERTKELQKKLDSKVFGQSHAVGTFVSGYFQACMINAMDPERTQPMATFLFAGPPGVGKTFLAESAAKAMDVPFRRFDMSEFSTNLDVQKLIGTDKNFQASQEGLLTSFVQKNPYCVVLLDEIEKAHHDVIYLFLQVLDAGVLRDSRTEKDVSFRNAILIFTTNAGKNLYEDAADSNLSTMPRQVVISALRKDKDPHTGTPFFPEAMCSRFASGNVVMFNHLDAHTLTGIVRKQFQRHVDEMKESMGVTTEADERLYSTLLMAEGNSADARMVKSRADSFWGTELYELYRLATEDRIGIKAEEIRRIQFCIDLAGCSEEVEQLFSPKDKPGLLVYSETPGFVENLPKDVCNLFVVKNFEEALRVFKKNDIAQFIFDVNLRGKSEYLNSEDEDTPAREMLFRALEELDEIPVYMVQDDANRLSVEERISFLRRGVRGFLELEDREPASLNAMLSEVAARVLQQEAQQTLACSSKVLSFETAQRLSEDKSSAEIILFDFSLVTAVEGEDAKQLVSAASRPDTKFDDVIGAEDAKAELQYFISYLKDPKQYMGSGVAAPKGVILYGPPGTGKTMLAKAMAGESGVTFIAAVGSQFFNSLYGESEESVRRVFAQARKYAPAILFIDEIDAIARVRTGHATNALEERVLTTLLSEMDGFKTDTLRPVFVLAATNYNVDQSSAMRLDPAVMRRFDRRIYVDLPDKADRRKYLERKMSANPRFAVSEKELDSLASRSGGMSLAQLESMLEKALRDCNRAGRTKIDDAAMEEAFESFNSGERREWSEETRLRTARHESGHALLSWLSGDKPTYVTIVSRGDFGGYMMHDDQEDRLGYTRRELLARIRTSLGGRASEMVYYAEEGLSTGASSDLQQATSLATRMLCAFGMDDDFGLATLRPEQLAMGEVQQMLRPKVNAILKQELEAGVALIGRNRKAIDAMVATLLDKNQLNAEEIDKLFTENAQQ